jgi:predicted MPP superfamily phosphohydrolase
MHLHLSFHSIITLAYTIPNIYLFLRIGQLFIEKDYKIRYTIIYLLIVSIYPASNLTGGWEAGHIFLTGIAGYLLPFYLYLFLTVLVFDIFLLLNRLFKVIPSVRLKDQGFKKTCLATVIFFSAAIVTGGVINLNTIRTSHYSIAIPGKSSVLRHLRIAFAADFHLQERTGIKFVRRFAGKIAEINPDIMIFGGDIIEGDSDDGNIQTFESILRGIQTKYGTYTVPGNHEYYAGMEKGSFFDKSGIEVLGDKIVVIDSSFSLAGRYDSHFSGRKPVNYLLSTASASLPLILVDHRPTEIDQVCATKSDVQLSGHTHNGQLFPINLITGRVYQLSWGYMKKGNTHFFVTSGIRLWGPPVRTAGKSEIMVIDIDFTGK